MCSRTNLIITYQTTTDCNSEISVSAICYFVLSSSFLCSNRYDKVRRRQNIICTRPLLPYFCIRSAVKSYSLLFAFSNIKLSFKIVLPINALNINKRIPLQRKNNGKAVASETNGKEYSTKIIIA